MNRDLEPKRKEARMTLCVRVSRKPALIKDNKSRLSNGGRQCQLINISLGVRFINIRSLIKGQDLSSWANDRG